MYQPMGHPSTHPPELQGGELSQRAQRTSRAAGQPAAAALAGHVRRPDAQLLQRSAAAAQRHGIVPLKSDAPETGGNRRSSSPSWPGGLNGTNGPAVGGKPRPPSGGSERTPSSPAHQASMNRRSRGAPSSACSRSARCQPTSCISAALGPSPPSSAGSQLRKLAWCTMGATRCRRRLCTAHQATRKEAPNQAGPLTVTSCHRAGWE